MTNGAVVILLKKLKELQELEEKSGYRIRYTPRRESRYKYQLLARQPNKKSWEEIGIYNTFSRAKHIEKRLLREAHLKGLSYTII